MFLFVYKQKLMQIHISLQKSKHFSELKFLLQKRTSKLLCASFNTIGPVAFKILSDPCIWKGVTEFGRNRIFFQVVNFSYMYLFVYRQKTYANTHLFTDLRTFYGIKISVIEKKLQPSENQICRYINILKKSLILR